MTARRPPDKRLAIRVHDNLLHIAEIIENPQKLEEPQADCFNLTWRQILVENLSSRAHTLGAEYGLTAWFQKTASLLEQGHDEEVVNRIRTLAARTYPYLGIKAHED